MSAGVYRITNKVTGEIYIGYSLNLQDRLSDYKRNSVRCQPLIFNSLQKHGYDNHQFDIIYEFEKKPTTSQLIEAESIFIRYYKYWKNVPMLNINDGGAGSGKWSDEKKKEKSESQLGIRRKAVLQYALNGKFIKRWISISQVSKTLNLDYNLLIRCLKQNSDNLSTGGFQWRYDNYSTEPRLGRLDLNGKLIDDWTNGAEFLRSIGKNSIKGKSSSILSVIKGKQNTAYGYKWKYLYKRQKRKYGNIKPLVKEEAGKPVLQYDSNGKFIRLWKSAVIAAEKTNQTISAIRRSAQNDYAKKHSRLENRFQWRYRTEKDFPRKIAATPYPRIVQYDKDGNFIKEWKSVKEIVQNTKVAKSSILRSINIDNSIGGGFQWKRYLTSDFSKKIGSASSFRKQKYISSIKILQYDLYGKFIKAWDYPEAAGTNLSISPSSIVKCTKGGLKTAGGFQWRKGLVMENMPDIKPVWIISQFDLNGKLVREWKGVKEIREVLGHNESKISSCIYGNTKEAYGYVWKYK